MQVNPLSDSDFSQLSFVRQFQSQYPLEAMWLGRRVSSFARVSVVYRDHYRLVVLTISRHFFGLSLNNQQGWKLALAPVPSLHSHILDLKLLKLG